MNIEASKKILENVPKSFRANARLLLKHLIDKAVPARITWDEERIVIIDGYKKFEEITELINDAMRERKTMKAIGRGQFARLVRTTNTPVVLVGNKKLLGITFIKILSPSRVSFTPKIPRKLSTTTMRKYNARERDKNARLVKKSERTAHCFFRLVFVKPISLQPS
ncbi:hypothetical protein P5V15_002549 [Pogonomyrmex californicus]